MVGYAALPRVAKPSTSRFFAKGLCSLSPGAGSSSSARPSLYHCAALFSVRSRCPLTTTARLRPLFLNRRCITFDLPTKMSDKEVEDLHQAALRQMSTTYTDPSTGFTVFTELAHLQRGTCCGNQCRHCPYGWERVTKSNARRTPKIESGNALAVATLLQHYAELAAAAAADNDSNNNASTPPPLSSTNKTGGRHGGHDTKKNVPYTRTGDSGTSQLLTGERRSKQDIAFEAMGTVDELCAVVGVAHAMLVSSNTADYGDLPDWLVDIMSRLFDIGSHVAKPRKSDGASHVFVADGVGGGFAQHHVDELERWIDVLTEAMPELRSFILPTGQVAAAQLHVCRTVCRRAERVCIPLVRPRTNDGDSVAVCDPNVLQYLNRLSDFFFSAARWVNHCHSDGDVQYRKPQRNAKQRVAVAYEKDEREK